LEPTTMYGVTKVAGELLCKYYATRFGVDVRSLRYPGIISHGTKPGGGTTDYAVEIFYDALERGEYTCFLEAETRLPMMYMPDAVQATISLMNTDEENITVRTSYNVTAFSFSAEELASEIAKRIEGFTVQYEPDFRQEIATSWPESVDDSAAHTDWKWQPKYDLSRMVDDMLDNLRQKLSVPSE
ncbi:MAG: NAD-dependent epimerase/dehydratase family protein, partial [Rubricoccaceae bacterium]|nr:NAD-dependent epimerase/dehydratase family protein [Rubricoccaceae bacterium]